jgi:hypothetical protein
LGRKRLTHSTVLSKFWQNHWEIWIKVAHQRSPRLQEGACVSFSTVIDQKHWPVKSSSGFQITAPRTIGQLYPLQ